VWLGGSWSYKTIRDTPGKTSALDIHDSRQDISRLEVSDAQETLGIHLALNGDTSSQVKKMIDMATNWADQMRSGKIPKQKVWIALASTIWWSLMYSLVVLNLSKANCERIMSPFYIMLYLEWASAGPFQDLLFLQPLNFLGSASNTYS
jgi:hypothetical protein